MRKLLLAASIAAVASVAALAQTSSSTVGPDDLKINQLIIYGDDQCPPDTEDTINVCFRRPSSDQYRIPEELRGMDNPTRESWANEAMELSRTGATGTGSCSTVGPGGQTGCLQQLIDQALAERYPGTGINWVRLIEQRRAERLGKIDEESEEIENELKARGE